MLIVLEGPDGTGKTTLATLLTKVWPAEIIHCTKETPNNWDYFSAILDEAKKRDIIVDRFFWGQFVYQSRKERHITPEQLEKLERRLENESGVLIYVCASEEDITKRLNARKEIPLLPTKILLAKYDVMANLAKCSVIYYNTSTGEVKLHECDRI